MREFCKLAIPAFGADDRGRFFEVRVRDLLLQNEDSYVLRFNDKSAFVEAMNKINNKLIQIFNFQIKLENDYIQKIESLKECVHVILESINVLPLQFVTKLVDVLFNYSFVYVCTSERNEEVKSALKACVASKINRSPETKRGTMRNS